MTDDEGNEYPFWIVCDGEVVAYFDDLDMAVQMARDVSADEGDFSFEVVRVETVAEFVRGEDVRPAAAGVH